MDIRDFIRLDSPLHEEAQLSHDLAKELISIIPHSREKQLSTALKEGAIENKFTLSYHDGKMPTGIEQAQISGISCLYYETGYSGHSIQNATGYFKINSEDNGSPVYVTFVRNPWANNPQTEERQIAIYSPSDKAFFFLPGNWWLERVHVCRFQGKYLLDYDKYLADENYIEAYTNLLNAEKNAERNLKERMRILQEERSTIRKILDTLSLNSRIIRKENEIVDEFNNEIGKINAMELIKVGELIDYGVWKDTMSKLSAKLEALLSFSRRYFSDQGSGQLSIADTPENRGAISIARAIGGALSDASKTKEET